jgi:hypothetical protein
MMRGHLASVQCSQRTAHADSDPPAVAISNRRPDRPSHDAAKQNPESLFHVIGSDWPCQRRYCESGGNRHHEASNHSLSADFVHDHLSSLTHACLIGIENESRLTADQELLFK